MKVKKSKKWINIILKLLYSLLLYIIFYEIENIIYNEILREDKINNKYKRKINIEYK